MHCVSQESVNVFCTGPGRKCLLCKPCINYATLLFWLESCQRQYRNEWVWLCGNKTLFTYKRRTQTGFGLQCAVFQPLVWTFLLLEDGLYKSSWDREPRPWTGAMRKLLNDSCIHYYSNYSIYNSPIPQSKFYRNRFWPSYISCPHLALWHRVCLLRLTFSLCLFSFCFWSLQDVEIIWNDNTVSESIRFSAQLGAMNLMNTRFIIRWTSGGR